MLQETAHRPWPLPAGRPAMAMRWLDLLFAHWPVEASALRPLIPRGLQLGTFDGQAWIGVVPFRMEGVRPPWCPPLPWVSAFAELNVRTYVSAAGKPGVWFFSLDAANPLAVRVARWTFHLPYFDARMRVGERDGWVHYDSRRTHRGAPSGVFRGRYRPVSEPYLSEPGTLEHWLTERYCLYAGDRRGQVFRGDIHHVPWPLQRAEAEIEEDTLTRPLGTPGTGGTPLERPDIAPLLHFARRLEVVAWQIVRVSDGS